MKIYEKQYLKSYVISYNLEVVYKQKPIFIYMKNNLLLIACAILAFSSCRKGDLSPVSKPAAHDSTTVISNIIRKPYNPNKIDFDYYTTDFTYSGKRLISAQTNTVDRHVIGMARPGLTNNFIYDDNQELTGSTCHISQGLPEPDWAIGGSKITCSNGQITKITFIQFDQKVSSEYTLTYKNGLLEFICDPNSVMIMYTYDSKGNNIKQCIEEYKNGKPTGKISVVTSSSFDENKNFQKALPLWVYFKCFDMAQSAFSSDIYFNDLQQSFTNSPGLNNPTNITTDGVSATIGYQYNSEGYPSVIVYPNDRFTWKYTYTKVY
jgi:hypothetical protein